MSGQVSIEDLAVLTEAAFTWKEDPTDRALAFATNATQVLLLSQGVFAIAGKASGLDISAPKLMELLTNNLDDLNKELTNRVKRMTENNEQ